MAADEVLGVSAQLDISDMLNSFNDLSKKLEKLGYDTEGLEKKINSAWNVISSTTDANSAKAQKAYKTVIDAIQTYQKQLENEPPKIKAVRQELNQMFKALEDNKNKLSSLKVGTSEWNDLNRIIEKREISLGRINKTYNDLQATFSDTQQVVTSLTSAFDVANAGRSISNVATGVNAGMHTAAAAAVGAESTAHAANAQNIGEETKKVQENAEAVKQANEASKQRATNSDAEAEAIKRVTERLQNGKVSEDEYLRTVENANNRIKQLTEEREELAAKQAQAYERNQDAYNKRLSGELTAEESDKQGKLYADIANNYAAQVSQVDTQIRNLQEGINNLTQAYNSLNETKQQQAQQAEQEKEQTDKTAEAIKAKEEEIKRLRDEYNKLSEQKPAFLGLGTDIKEEKMPFSSYKEWIDQTQEAKQKVFEAEAELAKLKLTAYEVKEETSDMWAGMGKDDIANVIKEDVEQLKILKSEYGNITDKNSDKAKENKQQQAEINKEILEGKERLKQMGTSYEDVVKNAKQAAKETKNIGKEAETASEKAKGIFDKMKSFVTKGLNPENLLDMIFSPKGATMAGITAVIAGLKNLTQISESLVEAMMPLKTYVDGGTLETLRQQFVAMEYDSVQSAEEMAAGATRWVKYFAGIRDNADVIADVTKSSNDFATVLGTTSEKAADYQLRIAGAFHQTALQAKENSTIIINASKQSTAKYEDFAQAIANTANRAQNTGVSLKELAAATAYGSSTFGSASESANAYVMMMSRLSTQTKNEFNPSVVGAQKALDNLAKSGKTNEVLTGLLGAKQAVLAKVFVQGAADIKKMQGGLDDEASAAKTLAGAESKLENQEKRLQNAKRALAHEINVNLTPAYINFLESCSTIIKGVGNFSTSIKNGLKDVLSFINKVDDAIKDSTIYALFGNPNKPIPKGTKNAGATLTIDKGYMNQFSENDPWYKKFWNGSFNRYGINPYDYNEKRRTNLKSQIEKIYNENLKKYGVSSPGKAMMATLNAYNHNKEFDGDRGLYSGDDVRKMVAKMMNTTRAENKAKVTGESLALGDFNGVDDKSGQNKLKQLQEQQRKFREQEAEQQAKELANAEKTKWDLYIAQKETGIARLENASEKEEQQHKLDYEKQKHAIEEEQKSLLQQNIAAAKQAYEKNPDNKQKEGFYASGLDKQVKLTTEQKALIQAKYDILDAQENAYDLKRLQEKTQSLYDYLKEYGTFKEKQLAIAEEYDKKIADAERQGDTYKAKSLREEKRKNIGDVKASEIESKIDYTTVFGNFGIILRDQMQDILKSMKDYSKTDTFKSKPINEQKEFLSRMNELSNQYGTSKWKDINFSQLGKLINEYNEKLKKRNDLEQKLNDTTEDLKQAQEEYNKAMKSGDANKKLDAKGKLGNAQTANDKARQDLQKADADLAGAQSNVTNSAQKLCGTLTSLDTLLQSMKSGSISSVWQSFVDFDNKVNGGKATKAVTDTIGKVLGKAFEGKSDLVSLIIGAILTLLDTIAEQGIGGIVGGLVDSILNAINGLIDNILSGKFIEQIGGALINGIGKILDNIIGRLGSVLSLGALSSKGPSAWFTNSNAEKVEEAINALTERNKSLQQSIDDLNDTMKNSSGEKSVDAYKEAYKLQEEQNRNYLKIAQEQAGYHGSHHSWSYYWNGFNDEQTQWIKDHVKSDFNGDLFSLTPEEMKALRAGNVDIWTQLQNTGKGGYGNSVVDKLNDYIDQADKLQDLTDQINESLTQVSFSSMRDDFFNNLMDMEKDAQDFADSFTEMMQKATLRFSLEKLLNTDLQNLYNKWGSKMQEGNLSKDDIDSMKKEYDAIVEEGLKQRDYWAQITGYESMSQSQQTATGKGIEAITSDQASSLIGIGYAMQIALEQGNEVRKAINTDVNYIRMTAETIGNNISEMRDIQYQGLEQLQAITKNTANLFQIKDDLSEMKKIIKDRY